MAASNDLQNLIDKAIADKTFQITWKGQRLTVEDARGVLKKLKEDEKKVSGEEKRASFEVSRALANARTRLTDVTRNYDAVTKNPNSTSAQLRAALNAVNTAQAEVDRLTGTKTPAPTTTTPTRRTVTRTEREGAPVRQPVTESVVTETPATTEEQPAQPAADEGTTPVRRQRRGRKEVAPVSDDFLDELAARFPAYADWTSEQAIAYFGDDLIQVLREISDGTLDPDSDVGRAAIERRFESTNYWLTVDDAVKKWDAYSDTQRSRLVVEQKRSLAQAFGDLQLDDATLTDLATTIQRTGLNEIGAKQLVYGRAFQRPASSALDTRAIALDSADADKIRSIARAYGYNPLDIDSQIEAILSGQQYGPTGTVLTEESFRQKAQRYAKGQYSWLSDQFDAGLTLNDIMGNYTEIASRVLEIDPSAIDYVGDPKWQEALGTASSGQLPLNQWVQKLKSDPQYGYQYTNQANAEVSKIVSDLEKAFGFRR